MPLARAVDVARPEGVAGDRVLDRRDQHAQPHRQPRVHDHVREREHARRAAHVLLHDEHAAVGLDVEPAGVEAHALADQRDLGVAGSAPGRSIRRGARRRRAADRVDQRKVLREQLVADDRPNARAVPRGERARGLLELRRAQSFAGVLMRSRASVTPSTMRERSAPSTPSGSIELAPPCPRPCGSG